MVDWFNNSLKDYIDKKEKIVFDMRKNDKICHILSFCLSLFFALILAFVGAFFSDIFAIVVFVVSFFVFICLIYNSQRATRYVLTQNGIYKITGLVFKNLKFVAYNQVTDVSMSRGLIQQICGSGSVGVGTASGNVVGSVVDGNGTMYSVDELDIDCVDNYQEIRKFIIEHRKK